MRGVMGANTAATMTRISDGASNTLLLAEVAPVLAEMDGRGTWAIGNTGSSLWGTRVVLRRQTTAPMAGRRWRQHTRLLRYEGRRGGCLCPSKSGWIAMIAATTTSRRREACTKAE